MREAHAHIAAFGQSLRLPSLSDCASLRDCLDHVRELAATSVSGAWIRFLGARAHSWPEGRLPTMTELDRAAPHRSVIIMSFDQHEAVCSSTALRAAGLNPGDRVEAHGEVCVDALGQATGLLREHAAYKVWGSAPEPTFVECRQNVITALQALSVLGFDEVDDMFSQDWLGDILADLERTSELPVRTVRLHPPISKLGQAHALQDFWSSDRVILSGGKLFADGTLSAGTAWSLTSYAHPVSPSLTFGQPMVTPAQLREAVALAESLDLSLVTHAIGDGAVRAVLDAIEAVGEMQKRSVRHRIEHCELIDAVDVPRFAQLNVVCSVQPCHLLTDMEVLSKQFPHRLDRVLPLRELIESGCIPAGENHPGLLWFGSDVPIVRANPEDSILAATQRRREGMPAASAIALSQAITEAQAWACFGR